MLYTTPDATASTHRISNPEGVPVTLIAGRDVPIEDRAIRQALSACALRPLLRARGADLERVVLTPDLHVGASVPVGMVLDTVEAVIPGAIGNDVGCGMRLAVFDHAADLDDETLAAVGERLRRVFFEGARDLPLRPADRLALLEHGTIALLDAPHVPDGAGTWSVLADGAAQHVEREHPIDDAGGVDAAMATWARRTGERDAQIGSLGGGNHFCELQRVAELVDGATAWSWGLRPGALAVMVHAGSLGFGHVASGEGRRAAQGGGAGPLLPLVDAGDRDAYLRAMGNAANVAAVNRLALTAMAAGAVADVLEAAPRWVTVGDAPHNLIWHEGGAYRHRKGACPAAGAGRPGPFVHTGEPVFVPGSMGDASWVLAGAGRADTASSACHGAGRVLSRGRAARTRDDVEDGRLRVVTPVDPRVLAAAGRRDLVDTHARRVREEAPRAYKPIGPVVDAVVEAGAARTVARLEPLLTVKG